MAEFVADRRMIESASPVRIPDSFVLLSAIDALRFACRVIWRSPGRTGSVDELVCRLAWIFETVQDLGCHFEGFIEGVIADQEAARVPPCAIAPVPNNSPDQTRENKNWWAVEGLAVDSW